MITNKISIDKHLFMLIISLIVVIASVAYYEISIQQDQNQRDQKLISKLDLLRQEANEPENITIIRSANLTVMVPENEGKISGFDKPIIIK